jgi:hypothetical protein
MDNQSQLWISLITPGLTVSSWFSNLVAALFSFGFGLFWTCPFWTVSVLVFFRTKSLSTFFKIAGIISLQGYLCIYQFWHGAQGLPGQRYILPYLVIFLPEVATFIDMILSKRNKLIFCVPLCTTLFFPCLDYRNTLSDVYSKQSYISGVSAHQLFGLNFPFFDVSFHPAVFAWRVEFSIFVRQEQMSAANSSDVVFKPEMILPMTSLSRIIFLLQSDNLQRADLINARCNLPAIPSVLPRLVRALLVMYLLLTTSLLCFIPNHKIFSVK